MDRVTVYILAKVLLQLSLKHFTITKPLERTAYQISSGELSSSMRIFGMLNSTEKDSRSDSENSSNVMSLTLLGSQFCFLI